MFAFGRTEASKVETEGDKDSVTKLYEAKQLGI
jgi:hypothetical protein